MRRHKHTLQNTPDACTLLSLEDSNWAGVPTELSGLLGSVVFVFTLLRGTL